MDYEQIEFRESFADWAVKNRAMHRRILSQSDEIDVLAMDP
jgi:hypothetical protein